MEKGVQKINVGILFGGKSAEHEVSLQSAKNICDAIDREKYNPILIGIEKSGKWVLSSELNFLLNADDPAQIKLNPSGESVALLPQSSGYINNLSDKSKNIKIDVIFPILHGTFGEDGTVQGLLKLANIPFVGASVLGSAVGMDKDVMKRLLRDAGIPIGKFIVLRSHESMPDFQKIVEEIGLPFFVKPANMGSSVGVSKIHNESEYNIGLSNAFCFDHKIILEQFIKGREIECAVLGNEEIAVSVLGEVVPNHEFYSYDAKYIDANGAATIIPANMPFDCVQKVQNLAVHTFRTLSCEGLGRVDFFFTDNGEIYVNEINTMPGFTKISMYPKLWEASGISYRDLIDRLIQLAIARFQKEQTIKTDR